MGAVEMVDISQFSKLKIPLAWSVIFAEGIGVRTYLYIFPWFYVSSKIQGVGIHRFRQTLKWGWEFTYSRDKDLGTTPLRINTLVFSSTATFSRVGSFFCI